jgi:hypothetical protein
LTRSALRLSQKAIQLSTSGTEGALLLLGATVVDQWSSIFADGFQEKLLHGDLSKGRSFGD